MSICLSVVARPSTPLEIMAAQAKTENRVRSSADALKVEDGGFMLSCSFDPNIERFHATNNVSSATDCYPTSMTGVARHKEIKNKYPLTELTYHVSMKEKKNYLSLAGKGYYVEVCVPHKLLTNPDSFFCTVYDDFHHVHFGIVKEAKLCV